MKVFNIKVENKYLQIDLKVTACDIHAISSFTPPCIDIKDKYSGINILIPWDQIATLLVSEVNE